LDSPNIWLVHLLQNFESSLETMFSIKSVKEGITIIMASYGVYELWSKVFLSWEEKLLLDGISKVLTKPPLVIRKSTLACFIGLTDVQLIELGNELHENKVTF